MARTALATILSLPDQGVGVSAGAQDLTFTAGDDVNGNDVPCTGKELVIVKNTDAGAQTVTFTAKEDGYGRTGAITAYSLAASDEAIFGPFPTDCWRQTDAKLYIDVSDANVELAVVRLA